MGMLAQVVHAGRKVARAYGKTMAHDQVRHESIRRQFPEQGRDAASNGACLHLFKL